MHRIERTPINEYESLCQYSEQPDLDETMVKEVSTGFALIAWIFIVGAFVWLLAVLIRMGMHFSDWKWLVQR